MDSIQKIQLDGLCNFVKELFNTDQLGENVLRPIKYYGQAGSTILILGGKEMVLPYDTCIALNKLLKDEKISVDQCFLKVDNPILSTDILPCKSVCIEGAFPFDNESLKQLYHAIVHRCEVVKAEVQQDQLLKWAKQCESKQVFAIPWRLVRFQMYIETDMRYYDVGETFDRILAVFMHPSVVITFMKVFRKGTSVIVGYKNAGNSDDLHRNVARHAARIRQNIKNAYLRFGYHFADAEVEFLNISDWTKHKDL